MVWVGKLTVFLLRGRRWFFEGVNGVLNLGEEFGHGSGFSPSFGESGDGLLGGAVGLACHGGAAEGGEDPGAPDEPVGGVCQ